MSIMLAGLKAVKQRRRMRSTRSCSHRDNGAKDDTDIGFDTSQFLVNHDVINNYDDDDDNDDDLDSSYCPEDESPMIATQSRKRWLDACSTQQQSVPEMTRSIHYHDDGSWKDTLDHEVVANNISRSAVDTTSSIAHNDDEDVNNNEDDDIVNAGNEALLFIYGHNVNLYTDVFHLPPHHYHLFVSSSSTKQQQQQQHVYDNNYELNSLRLLELINQSYNEQMQYLNHPDCGLAMKYFRSRHYMYMSTAKEGSSLNKYAHVMKTLDPKIFLEIYRDALVRAHTILMHDDSRKEYDELLMLHQQDSYGHEDFNHYGQEEKDSAHENNNFGARVTPSGSAASMESDCSKEEQYYSDDDDNSGIFTVQNTADEDDEEYNDEDYEGRIWSNSNQTIIMAEPSPYRRISQLHSQPQQYSPTDPMEFDMLVQNSLDDEEYFNQFHRSIKAQHKKANNVVTQENEGEMFFDPFNLHCEHQTNNMQESFLSLFPEKAIPSGEYSNEDCEYYEDNEDEDEGEDETVNENTTMSSFVCQLPINEDDEDDEITMGQLIELQEKMSRPKKSRLYLDEVLKSSDSEGTDCDEDEDEDDDYDEAEAEEDDDDEYTSNDKHDERGTTPFDDSSVITKTKNYFLDDLSAFAASPKQVCKSSGSSLVYSTTSTSSHTSVDSSSVVSGNSERKSKRKTFKAKVQYLVKSIGSKSKMSTPKGDVMNHDTLPQEDIRSSSNTSTISTRSRTLSSSIHPKQSKSSSFDLQGLHLSETNGTTITSSALVSKEADEVAEIENLLSIASTFSAMDAAAAIAEKVRNRKLIKPNDVHDDGDSTIDCFSTADDNDSYQSSSRPRRHLSRFVPIDDMMIEEEEDFDDEDHSQSAEVRGWSSSPPSSSSRGVFGSCIDNVGTSIDKTLDSVEHIFAC